MTRRQTELPLLALWLLATAWLRPLTLPDEGRYAGVAWEMARAGSWVPTLDGLPYFHKPPLSYGLAAAGMALGGPVEWAVRLAPALLAFVLGAALFAHLRRTHGPAVARTGLLVLATCPLYFFGAQFINHDMGVAGCITLAVLAWARADSAVDEGAPRTARRAALAGWLACGLGVLAKGLIGVVLPLAVVLPWLAWRRRGATLRALAHPVGPLAGAALALPWMLAMQHRYPGFFDYFVVEQHFRRYAGQHFNNPQPWWFFVAVLPLLTLPWSATLPWMPRRLARAAAEGQGAQVALHAWWVVVIVGFFSLPTSKLVGYAMPALAPAAALCAIALAGAAGTRRRVVALAAGGALLCLGAVAVVAWQAPGSHRDVAKTLGAGWRAGDRLAYIDGPYFDVRFYARVDTPALVVSDWNNAALHGADNWRKELADAARFAPAAGRERLWAWERVPELACTTGRLWIVTAPDQRARLAPLEPLTVVQTGRHALLLRREGDAACALAAPR